MSCISQKWLGLVSYQQGLDAQHHIYTNLSKGEPETILGLEHHPVITFGKRGGQLKNETTSVPIVHTKRGGLATAHEPGQLIIYPIIDIQARNITIRDWVYGLEEIILLWLLEYKLHGIRDSRAGVWLQSHKIASIGIQICQGISTHGMAINICNDLETFSFIETCGDPQIKLTNLRNQGIDSTPSESFYRLSTKLKEWIDSI